MTAATISTRINRFDNLKGLAITLVVIGHLICLTNDPELNFIRNFIFLIHLPIFFFVSGYFSKIDESQPFNSFKRLMIPFFIFCIIYWLFQKYILLDNPKTLFVYPGYGLWFLISLFLMKMMLPIINRFRYPLVASFVFAIAIGFIDCNFFGISRTFVYLPIFLVGFYYNQYVFKFQQKYDSAYSLLCKRKAVLVLVALTILALIICAETFTINLISLKYAYHGFNSFEIISRAIVIGIGILSTLILNQLMTNREISLTQVGKNSMVVYIFHLFMVKILKSILKPYYAYHPGMTLLAAVALSLIIVFILSRDFISSIYNRFIEMICDLLFLNS